MESLVRLGIKGTHTFRLYRDIPEQLETAFKQGKISRHGVEKYQVGEWTFKNLVVNDGLEAIADVLAGIGTYTGIINYGAVGTGTTAPAASDTDLGAEVARTEIASSDVSSIATGQIVLSFFFTQASFTNANIKEWGLFIDGTSVADSGQMFSRTLFNTTISKAANETLTVDSIINVNAS